MIRMIYVIHSYDEQGDKGLRTLVEKRTKKALGSSYRFMQDPISLYWLINRNPYNGLQHYKPHTAG